MNMSIKIHLLEQGWKNFCCGGQTVNILGISGHTVSISITRLCPCNRKEATGQQPETTCKCMGMAVFQNNFKDAEI